MILSGQKTVASAGTAEALGTGTVNKPMMVKALPSNTDVVYIGNDGSGDVSSSNGLVLSAGDAVVFENVWSLSTLMVDAAKNGEGVSWIVLSV